MFFVRCFRYHYKHYPINYAFREYPTLIRAANIRDYLASSKCSLSKTCLRSELLIALLCAEFLIREQRVEERACSEMILVLTALFTTLS